VARLDPWSPGVVFAIPLGALEAFGIVVKFPLVAIFDRFDAAGATPPIGEIVATPIAFSIWVMKAALGRKSTWRTLGGAPMPASINLEPWFWKIDTMTDRVSLYRGGVERPVEPDEQVSHLEQAAVWSAVHVERRLVDQAHGTPNKALEQKRRQQREAVGQAMGSLGAKAPAVTAAPPSAGDRAEAPPATAARAKEVEPARRPQSKKLLQTMYAGEAFPKVCVDRVRAVLVGLDKTLRAARPSNLRGFYELTHAATVEINELQAVFEEHDSEIETGAAEAIAAEFERIAHAHGFDADVEEMIAPREW
jgi:hypothetical protein